MTIREIPRAFEYTCDKCGAVHRQENACGHYTESTPPDWLTIKVRVGERKAVRFAVKPEALLCTDCACKIVEANEDWIRP